MGLATTIQHVRAPGRGFTVPGLQYKADKGKPTPIVFDQLNQIVDLNRVEIPAFVQALRNAEVQRLIASGTFVLVRVDVSEAIEQALRTEEAKYTTVTTHTTGGNHASETIVHVLEPGVQVAMGAGWLPPNPVATAPETFSVGAGVINKPTTTELEPGVAVGVAQSAKPEVASKLDEAPVPAWKDGLNFDKQLAYVKKSVDAVFLQSVIDDPTESLKIKRAAKETLAKLKPSS